MSDDTAAYQDQMYAHHDQETVWRLTDGSPVTAHVTVFPDRTVFAIDDWQIVSTWNSQIVDHPARFARDERVLQMCGYSTNKPSPKAEEPDFGRIAKALEGIAASLEKMANPPREVTNLASGRVEWIPDHG